MLKNKRVVQLICSITAYAFAFAILPRPVQSARLAPVSFDDMYSMAQDGNVEGLRASIHRGLNIDYPNKDGDTGLCVAAKRHDSYTYNSFRAAGANPRHPCTQNISNYDEFVRNSRAVPVTEDARTAYAALGKEEYKVAPWVWWAIGGAILAGTIAAIALSGGGGGGGGSGSNDNGDGIKNLGGLAAQKGTVQSTVYTAQNNTVNYNVTNSKTANVAAVNLSKSVLTDTNYLDVILKANRGGIYTNAANITLQAGSGIIAMDALQKSSVVNNGYINIDSYNGSVGMVASEESTAVNNGVGVISHTGNNGIDLNFSGYKDTDTIIGMYADTKSSITNNGDIRGTAILASADPTATTDSTSTSSSGGILSGLLNGNGNSDTQTAQKTPTSSSVTGTLIGMEARLIKADATLNQYTMSVTNSSSGQINLSAGDGGTDTEIKVNIIGMGSFLDDGFMNGSLNITRAENIILKNDNKITLGYTGYYTLSSDKTLRKGTGGVVGIRADANTQAYNNGEIKITLEDYTSVETGIDVSAGMQSVHGGNLTNLGLVNIKTSSPNKRINYGMVSVEGDGTVSGLYTPLNQTLFNATSGILTIEAANSYGIASFNGGNLNNAGTINLGTDTTTQYTRNIGMYGSGKSTRTTLENTGTINVYSNHSIAMENDFSGDTVIENKGQINIYEDATDSFVFGGAYSEAYNYKFIDYYATSDVKTNSSTPGTTENPLINYETSVGTSAMSTKGVDIDGNSFVDEQNYSSSNTEKIGNTTDAKITLHGSSYVSAMSVETKLGIATNNGEIVIFPNSMGSSTNSTGMYIYEDAISNAGIINNGTITTNSRFSAAMASDSQYNAGVVNNGKIITLSDNEYTMGIYAANKSYIHNYGEISMNNNNSAAIYLKADAATVRNFATGIINVGSADNHIENGYGILAAQGSTATITNEGEIAVYTDEQGAGVSLLGQSTFTNRGTVHVYTDNTYGIYIGGAATVTNATDGTIYVGPAVNLDDVTASSGIYINQDAGAAVVRNSGTIYVSSKQTGYGIYSASSSADITNSGTINLDSQYSTALYGLGTLTNEGTINVYDNYSNAMATAGASSLINNGSINVGTEAYPLIRSNAMTVLIDATGTPTLTNNGTIDVYSASESYAMSAYSAATLINNNTINLHSAELTPVSGNINPIIAVYLNHSGATFTNNKDGVINVGDSGATANNTEGYGIKADAAGSITNIGTINVNQKSAYGIYLNSASSATITNAVNAAIKLYGENDVAIYAKNATVYNNGSIQFFSSSSPESSNTAKGVVLAQSGSVTNEGLISLTKGIGIQVLGSGTVTNNGLINVQEGIGIEMLGSGTVTNNSFITVNQGDGIHVDGDAKVTNNGTIVVSSGAAIFAYVPAKTTEVSITNTASGQIYVTGSSSPNFAIYIKKNYNLDTETQGETTKKVADKTTVSAGSYAADVRYYCPGGGNGCVLEESEDLTTDYDYNGSSIDQTDSSLAPQTSPASLFGLSSPKLLKSAKPKITLTNNGLISVAGDVDFGTSENETEAVIGSGGQYQATSFTGELGVSADIVAQGFEDKYEVEDALVGADNGVSVYSKSALFSAAKSINGNGNLNVIMTRKSFNETLSDPQMGAYLENNYALGRNEVLFADLKSATDTGELDKKVGNIFGFDFLPDLIKQAFDTEKIVQREITEDILLPANDNVRHLSTILIYKNEVDGKHNLIGYKDKVISGYGFSDMRINSRLRAGLGLSATRVLSDYDDGSTRYNNVIELFAPFSSSSGNFTTAAKPKLGFGRGHYRRLAGNKAYKDNTKEYYYGADTQAKGHYDFDFITIEPTLGFNLTGIYFRGGDESNGGIHTKADNIISAQSVIGADIKKKIELNQAKILSFVLGGRYYHEFGDKSHISASFDDLAGNYRINNDRFQRNTGLVDFLAEYEFNGFKLGASVNVPIEQKNNIFYLFNFGYAM